MENKVLTSVLKKLRPDAKSGGFLHVWQKSKTALFFILLGCAVAGGGYIWYVSIYHSSWSSEEIKQYANTQNTGVAFKEEEFKKALGDIESRSSRFAAPVSPSRDVFAPY